MLTEIEKRLINMIDTKENRLMIYSKVIATIKDKELKKILELGKSSLLFYASPNTNWLLKELDKINCTDLTKEARAALEKYSIEMEKLISSAKDKLRHEYITKGDELAAKQIDKIEVANLTYNTITVILGMVMVRGATTNKGKKELLDFFSQMNNRKIKVGYVLRFFMFKKCVDENADDERLARRFYNMIINDDPLRLDLVRILGRFDRAIALKYLTDIKDKIKNDKKEKWNSLKEAIDWKRMKENLELMERLLNSKHALETVMTSEGKPITRISNQKLYPDADDIYIPL